MEKTKITDNVKTTSLSHSINQGNSNSNISNNSICKEIEDSIRTNNRGHEDKKNVTVLGDSIIKHVSGYDIAVTLDKCKVFVKRFTGAKVRYLKDDMKPSLRGTIRQITGTYCKVYRRCGLKTKK